MEVVDRQPTEAQWGDCSSRWRVCKHVASNAIVIAQGPADDRIGAGQMSRVDAVRIALEKAHEHGHSLTGASLASDAFFPSPMGRGWRSRRASTPSSSLAARSVTST